MWGSGQPANGRKAMAFVAHFALTVTGLLVVCSSFSLFSLFLEGPTRVSRTKRVVDDLLPPCSNYRANLATDCPAVPYQTSHFLMPSTSLALTPGLGSFLKSLKTHPVEASIENLISCAALPRSL